jgi:integrase/recombinase XerC
MANINEALNEYVSDLNISKSDNTVKTYTYAVQSYVEYLHAESGVEDTERIELKTALSYIRVQARHGLSRGTLAVYAAAIRSFLRWLALEGISSFGFEAFLQTMERLGELVGPPGQRIPKIPKEEDVELLFRYVRWQPPYQTPREKLLWYRNRALLEMIRATGARVSEVCNLYADELDPDLRAATITGKGDKERKVWFDGHAWTALLEYIDKRGISGHVPVFIRHDNAQTDDIHPADTRVVIYALEQACKAVGIDYINPHKFRHRYATIMLALTGDLAVTQDLMGHANPATTRIYAQVADQRLAAARDLMEKATV